MKARYLLPVACVIFLLVALGNTVAAKMPGLGPPPVQTTATETPEPTATSPMEGIIETRTPEPTATPGWLAREVEELATKAGLTGTEFLGLETTDWINLAISILIVLGGYLVGTWLIRRVLPEAVLRTPLTFDDQLLEAIGPNLRWLAAVLALNLATIRLTFLSADLKSFLGDIYFVVAAVISLHILWRTIGLGEKWYRDKAAQEGREDQLAPLITLLGRLARIVVVVIGASTLLARFGINVSALAAALGIGGLAISLAAQDTIADAIAGLIILVDQPFRIGDRIEIQGVGTWGDVVDIGIRTTRIRTRDNRMVIVPNSILSKHQVINYTFPDPRYRIETHVGIAYGTDLETARQVIVDTVRGIEGVLPDRPVDALYVEMGDSAMIIRVRWWIESYIDTRRMLDRVHSALQAALDGAGIEMPYPTYDVNLSYDEKEGGRRSEEA